MGIKLYGNIVFSMATPIKIVHEVIDGLGVIGVATAFIK